MTMFTAETRHLCGGYGGGGEGFGGGMRANYGFSGGGVGSDLMAEDDINSTSSLNNEESTSKDEGNWLQLSIGGGGSGQESRRNNGSSPLVELDLMPSNTHSPSMASGPEFRPPRPVTNFSGYGPTFYNNNLQHHGIGIGMGMGIGSSSSSFHSHPHLHPHPRHQEINWAFRPIIPISIAAASPSSSSLIGPGGSYFPRPLQIYDGGPGVDFRVIQPPRRPHSGIWFMLQASQNQEREPLLPQISKSYLRIKDGKMTIRLVIKYLVNKLSLENESEIEIRCKGQRLVPFLTLQHVRDNIWSSPPRDFITLLPNSSTTHHIMVLHYARTTTSSPSN